MPEAVSMGEMKPEWTSDDVAETVKRIAAAITCDYQGETRLILYDGDLWALSRVGDDAPDCGVYIAIGRCRLGDRDLEGMTPPILLCGRSVLKALRELIDAELSKPEAK